MEEKDISGIAGAVAKELAKLNAEKPEDKDKIPSEIFKCPECEGEVAAGIPFCQHCGCALEWED